MKLSVSRHRTIRILLRHYVAVGWNRPSGTPLRLYAVLQLNTSLYQAPLRTGYTILVPKILVITHSNLYLYYLYNSN